MHRANASVVLLLGLLACAPHRPAALGWSLGGEAHVFVVGDDFARDFYHALTGRGRLSDALAERPLITVEAARARPATVLSAAGAAPARLTLARFHAPQRCGYPGLVTELVLAFPPGGNAAPSHVTVVALLDAQPFAGGSGSRRPPLSTARAQTLIRTVAEGAELATRGATLGLLHAPSLDPDRATDAGEVVPLRSGYGVGFRATFVSAVSDTVLITGVAIADSGGAHLKWIVQPRRMRLSGSRITQPARSRAVRYSLRGAVAGEAGDMLLLVDEFAEISARDSRATAVDPATGRVVAAQPLALRCP